MTELEEKTQLAQLLAQEHKMDFKVVKSLFTENLFVLPNNEETEQPLVCVVEVDCLELARTELKRVRALLKTNGVEQLLLAVEGNDNTLLETLQWKDKLAKAVVTRVCGADKQEADKALRKLFCL